MAKDRTPVLKRCRALGLESQVLGLNKRSKRQVARSRRKASEYAIQLKEKQKVKFIYGVLEKQFRNYFKKADRMTGITGDNLLILLESRLDNIVYRMGLASTRREARQLVNHGHFLINGKRADIPSMSVYAGDVISVKARSMKSVKFQEIKELGMYKNTPEWLDVDGDNLTGKVITLPRRDQIETDVNEQLIVELYSR